MIKTSIGVQELRRRIATKAKADANHRFWGLFCHVWKHDVLLEAYRLAKINRGAPGIDGKSFDDVEREGVFEMVLQLSTELQHQTYQPEPLRIVKIPKDNGKERIIKIATIRDRVVQGALKIVLEPIFEMDFQDGSFGYRPKHSAHQALQRVKQGLGRHLFEVIDLDLKSYFDTVRHDLLLAKIAKRVDDDQIMWLCKRVLKSGGKIGIPQGSIIGPVFSNLFLNDIDKMLEKAQAVTQHGAYETIRYTRFADDLIVMVSSAPWIQKQNWSGKLLFRLEQELGKLKLSINRDKTKIIRVDYNQSFNFLGYTFRVSDRGKYSRRSAEYRPMRKKRTELLRAITTKLRKRRFRPVQEVVKQDLNPMIRGWVNYFRAGNSRRDLNLVSWQIECKVRRFATRQTPKNRKGGRRWTTWSRKEIYGDWGLYSDYRPLTTVKSTAVT